MKLLTVVMVVLGAFIFSCGDSSSGPPPGDGPSRQIAFEILCSSTCDLEIRCAASVETLDACAEACVADLDDTAPDCGINKTALDTCVEDVAAVSCEELDSAGELDGVLSGACEQFCIPGSFPELEDRAKSARAFCEGYVETCEVTESCYEAGCEACQKLYTVCPEDTELCTLAGCEIAWVECVRALDCQSEDDPTGRACADEYQTCTEA